MLKERLDTTGLRVVAHYTKEQKLMIKVLMNDKIHVNTR